VSRRAPRPLSAALTPFVDELAPATPLGRLQQVWPAAAGGAIATAARPTAVHDGVVSVTCDSAVWAQELELVAGVLIERLNEQLGEASVIELRCRTGPP
jgi:predicted nucleic acid-binding Zn ribbon protein